MSSLSAFVVPFTASIPSQPAPRRAVRGFEAKSSGGPSLGVAGITAFVAHRLVTQGRRAQRSQPPDAEAPRLTTRKKSDPQNVTLLDIGTVYSVKEDLSKPSITAADSQPKQEKFIVQRRADVKDPQELINEVAADMQDMDEDFLKNLLEMTEVQRADHIAVPSGARKGPPNFRKVQKTGLNSEELTRKAFVLMEAGEINEAKEHLDRASRVASAFERLNQEFEIIRKKQYAYQRKDETQVVLELQRELHRDDFDMIFGAKAKLASCACQRALGYEHFNAANAKTLRNRPLVCSASHGLRHGARPWMLAKRLEFEVCITDAGPVGLVLSGRPLTVESVHPEAPLAVHSVEVGSILLSANDINADPLSRQELVSLLRQRPLHLRFRKSSAASWPRSPRPEQSERMIRFEVEVTTSSKVIGLVPDNWPPNPVFVAAVVPGSLMEKEGVQVGDQLCGVNARMVRSFDADGLALELRKRPSILTFQRELKTERSESPGPLKMLDLTFGPQQGMLGIVPETWPPGPVLLGAVVPGSAAALGGARSGDVLLLVNDMQAALLSSDELSAVLRRRPLSVRFLRGAGAAASVNELLLQALTGPDELLQSQEARSSPSGRSRSPAEVLERMAQLPQLDHEDRSRSASPGPAPVPRLQENGRQSPPPRSEASRWRRGSLLGPDSQAQSEASGTQQHFPPQATATRRTAAVEPIAAGGSAAATSPAPAAPAKQAHQTAPATAATSPAAAASATATAEAAEPAVPAASDSTAVPALTTASDTASAATSPAAAASATATAEAAAPADSSALATMASDAASAATSPAAAASATATAEAAAPAASSASATMASDAASATTSPAAAASAAATAEAATPAGQAATEASDVTAPPAATAPPDATTTEGASMPQLPQ
ncbi:unnamed protein product [Effrenium voratum]|nr:unnamed protein product [Effrenium voratum]